MSRNPFYFHLKWLSSIGITQWITHREQPKADPWEAYTSQHCTHRRVKSHSHSASIIENSAVHHFSGCGKRLWFSNTSKLLTISKDWMWHSLCQRQWIQCLALRLHVSKGIFVCLPWKKNQTLYLLGKEKSSSLHSKKSALWVLSYNSWIKP